MARALFPDEVATSDPTPDPSRGPGLAGPVDVLVDRSGPLGPLSYIVPTGVTVRRGDAVSVPFGRTTSYGVVLGLSPTENACKATKALLEVYGKRVTAVELDVAARVARHYFCPLSQIAARLAPRDGKASPAVASGDVKVVDTLRVKLPEFFVRRVVACAPLADQSALAAAEAARLATTGQVLVLCPTKQHVTKVLRWFSSGAVRLDAKSQPGSWKGFSQGSVRIAVATRTAALYSADSLAGIVVVDEEHPGHREKAMPYTHARDLAAIRTQVVGCALVVLSASPSASALGSRVKAVTWGSRRDWPRVVVAKENDPSSPGLPREVVGLVAPLMLVDEAAVWLCARCASRRRSAPACSRCGSSEVFQANWDPVRAKKALPACTPVTVGQLATSSADAIVVPVDGLLSVPSLQPELRAATIFTQASRAVRAEGTVVVLTRQPDHALVSAWRERSPLSVAARLWEAADGAKLPPFATWVRVWVAGKVAPDVALWPGTVFGPRPVKGEWEVVVSLPRTQRDRLLSVLQVLRTRRKIRVEVL